MHRGKGLTLGQMGVWVVRRTGLPWETRLLSHQALTAPKTSQSCYSNHRSPGEGRYIRQQPSCQGDHRISPPHSSLLFLLSAKHRGPQPLQQVLRVLASADSSVFCLWHFSHPYRDSPRLPIQQLRPAAVHATQSPPPPPREPRPESSS